MRLHASVQYCAAALSGNALAMVQSRQLPATYEAHRVKATAAHVGEVPHRRICLQADPANTRHRVERSC